MFAYERQEHILILLKKQGKVLVKELSEQYQVTEDCIRKDLAVLEKNHGIKRVYGGAVLERVNMHQLFVAQRKGQSIAAKQAIAVKALALAGEDDFLFLDISTSNIALAHLLASSGRRFSIATNMVEAMEILSGCESIDLTFIGGLLNRSRDGFVGSLANSMIAQLRFDVAFLGAVGLDVPGNAVFTYTQEDGFTKREILRCSRRAYIVAETEKLERNGNFCYAGLDDFSGVVMETVPPDAVRHKMAEYHLEVI